MNRKFIQTVSSQTIATLEAIADDRGITVQQLIRGIIVPDWLRREKAKNGKKP